MLVRGPGRCRSGRRGRVRFPAAGAPALVSALRVRHWPFSPADIPNTCHCSLDAGRLAPGNGFKRGLVLVRSIGGTNLSFLAPPWSSSVPAFRVLVTSSPPRHPLLESCQALPGVAYITRVFPHPAPVLRSLTGVLLDPTRAISFPGLCRTLPGFCQTLPWLFPYPGFAHLTRVLATLSRHISLPGLCQTLPGLFPYPGLAKPYPGKDSLPEQESFTRARIVLTRVRIILT